MAKFGDVFTTTLKVLASLFIISLVIGIVYAIFTNIGSSGSGGSVGDYTGHYEKYKDVEDEDADEAPTKMPLSQWKRVIADDTKGHCIREGMTAAEVEQAVGKPTNARTVTYTGAVNGSVWEYTTQVVVTKPCSKYEGDKCADPVQHETKTAALHFSPKGHLTYPFLNGVLKIDSGETSSCY